MSPEVILDMEWDCKVDIRSIGMMTWYMTQGNNLFFAERNRLLDDEQYLAEMVSLMGPPPPEFIRRSEKALQYWDNQGNRKGSIPIPEQSLEMREAVFWRRPGALFKLLAKCTSLVPEERPIAEELAYDDFLMQPILRQKGLA